MSGSSSRTAAAAAAGFLLAGCVPYFKVDLRVKFPDPQADRALRVFEREVRGRTPAAEAGEFRTPRILEILKVRRARYGELLPLFRQGRIGEDHEARLAQDPQGTGPLSAKEAHMVEDENRDRRELLGELGAVRGLAGTENLNGLAQVYTIVLRDLAGEGWWIRGAEGIWVRSGSEGSFKEEESE